MPHSSPESMVKEKAGAFLIKGYFLSQVKGLL